MKRKRKSKPATTALAFPDLEGQRRSYMRKRTLAIAMECEVLGGRAQDLINMVQRFAQEKGMVWFNLSEHNARKYLQNARNEFAKTQEKDTKRLRARYMARFERLYSLSLQSGQLNLAADITEKMALADGVLKDANQGREKSDSTARRLGRIADKLKQALQRHGGGSNQRSVRDHPDDAAG